MALVLAHSGLDITEIGVYEGLAFLGYLLTFAWVNALGTAYLRVRQDSAHPGRWLIFYLLVALILGLLVCLAFGYGLRGLSTLFLNGTPLKYGLPYGCFVLGLAAGYVVEQEAIADQAGRRLLLYSASSYGLQSALFAVPLLAGYSLFVALWLLALSSIYRLIWVYWRYVRVSDTQPPIASERTRWANSATYLLAYGSAAMLVTIVDAWLVTWGRSEPESALALWRYGARELPLLGGIVAGLTASAMAEHGGSIAKTAEQLRRRSGRLLLPVVGLACALALSARWWWPLAFGDQLYPAHAVFSLLLLIVPTRLVLTQALLVSLDLERVLLGTALVEAVINVAVSLALLPSLGLLGVAIGTVTAYTFERLSYMYQLRRRGISPQQYVALGPWFAASLVLAVCVYVGTDFASLLAVR